MEGIQEYLFANLVSTSATTSGAAAAALADLLEEQHSTEHHRRVGELIASAKPHEQAGGLAAIRALLLIDGEDLGPRLSTYAAPLRTALLRAAGDPDALNAACEYYGELVRRGRDPDVLEAEVRCALDALRVRAPLRDRRRGRESERPNLERRSFGRQLPRREVAPDEEAQPRDDNG